MQLCAPCRKKNAAYKRAHLRGDPKRPRKVYCLPCRVSLRERRKLWRRDWVSKHRDQVNAAQKAYRKRLKKVV